MDTHPLLLTIAAHSSLTPSPIRTGLPRKTEPYFFFIRGSISNNLSHCTCSLTIFFSPWAFFKSLFPDQGIKSCYFYLVPFIFQKKGTKNDFAQCRDSLPRFSTTSNQWPALHASPLRTFGCTYVVPKFLKL